jgi:hypothetical protein
VSSLVILQLQRDLFAFYAQEEKLLPGLLGRRLELIRKSSQCITICLYVLELLS